MHMQCLVHSSSPSYVITHGLSRAFTDAQELLIQLFPCLPCQEAPLHQELHPHESVCVVHPESRGRHFEGNHIIRHVFQPTQGRPRMELLLELCGMKNHHPIMSRYLRRQL